MLPEAIQSNHRERPLAAQPRRRADQIAVEDDIAEDDNVQPGEGKQRQGLAGALEGERDRSLMGIQRALLAGRVSSPEFRSPW